MWEEVARLEQGYYERGHREGGRDGRDEGRQEKAIENARIMLADGLDLASVVKYTGLLLTDVIALADQKADDNK